MSTLSCREIRERLLEGEPDATLLAHAETCAECRPILAALREVDEDLAALTPIDAPDALVERTIAAVRADGEHESPSLLAAAFAILTSAIGALVVAPVTALRWLLGVGTQHRTIPIEDRGKTPSRRGFGLAPVFALSSVLIGILSLMTFSRFGVTVKSKTRGAEGEVNGLPMTSSDVLGGEATGESWWRANDDLPNTPSARAATAPSAHTGGGGGRYEDWQEATETTTARADDLVLAQQRPVDRGLFADEDGRETVHGDLGGLDEAHDGTFESDNEQGDTREPATDQPVFGTTLHHGQSPDGPRGHGQIAAIVDGTLVAATPPSEVGDEVAPLRQPLEEPRAGYREGSTIDTLDSRAARGPSYWELAQAITGLTFASSQSWWANTYVPGDAQLRVLHARLAASPSPLAGTARSALALAELASPTTPSVAAPTDRAIAIGVHADTTAIEGPTRVRVEVALRAIDQAAGRRGALRVALVVDARNGLGADETAHLRSLLASLSHSLTPRDRVILTAAGPGGGTLVPLGVLRHGQVEVALRHLESTATIAGEAIPTSLEDALAAGLEAVAVDDDGAGLTLLVTPSGAHDSSVDQALHLGAVAGVPTTAIGIGAAASTSSLDAIALAGEGRRRVVLSDEDATRAVREELTAASRLVARALRVRIRLADGVQLVDVVGSHSLDADETRRTRESERAIDQSLARRLGIGQDRDDDDSGVRILVPSFYAGDSHTIVLDLLVSRPGSVLDVDVRFKDLVRLGNGTASSALALEAGTEPRGPQELRVVASYVGHDVAGALDEAATLVDLGDLGGARARLYEARTLIDQARASIEGLGSVRSVAADASLLDQFIAAIDGASDTGLVAASLHYAAARRIVIPQLQASAP